MRTNVKINKITHTKYLSLRRASTISRILYFNHFLLSALFYICNLEKYEFHEIDEIQILSNLYLLLLLSI